MKKIRSISLFLIVLMLSFAVFACGDSSEKQIAERREETKAQENLTADLSVEENLASDGQKEEEENLSIDNEKEKEEAENFSIDNEKEEAEKDKLIYKNTRYGFAFSLPQSWSGYSIIEEEWKGLSLEEETMGEITETGPMVIIRHPEWTEENPRQDIPILVFSLAQWEALQKEKFHIGAAPIGPTELNRNSKYVFALPARYNFAFLPGYEEVEEIMENKPLMPLEPEEYKEKESPTFSVSLGGISLGDSPEKVAQVLGSDYEESQEEDILGAFGEDVLIWRYEKGITVTFGKDTKKVIKVVAYHPDFETDLGIKIGDKAQRIFEKYEPISQKPVSRHNNEVLTGWFDMGEGEILIFDFDRNDNTPVNGDVLPDAQVQEIILGYWKHFD